MAYGTAKIDIVTFTNGGVDQDVSISGIVASTSGNLSVTGTVSGTTFTGVFGQFNTLTAVSGVFTSQISGNTVTGNTGQFNVITGDTAGFTTITGTTVTGTTANFITLSGTTITGNTGQFNSITGNTGQFNSITGNTAGFTTITGTTVTGATANFITLSGTTITGNTAGFTTITGTTVTGVSGIFNAISGGVYTFTSGIIESGNASNPSLVFQSDLDTGVYSPGDNQFAIATSGVERVEYGTSEVVFNDGGSNYDLRVEGETKPNLFLVDASTDSVNVDGELSVAGDLFLTGTGVLDLPVGTTAERPVTPDSGMIRFNSSLSQFEGYNGAQWGPVGFGATGGGADTVFFENNQTVTNSYTIGTNKNAMSAGPVTINTGVTVTIPANQSWVIV